MADDDARDEILGLDRRKALLTAGLAALLGLGAVALIGQAADYGELREALAEAEPAWVAAAAGGQLLAYLGYVLGYHGVARARGGPRLGYRTVTRIVGLGFGAYVVGSSAGGLAVDFWALTRAGEDVHAAGRRVLGLNTLQWAALGTWAAIAGAVVLLAGGDAPLGMSVGWLVAVPAAVAAAAWISSPRRVERFAALPPEPASASRGRHVGRWARWLWSKVRVAFADAIGGVAFVRWLVTRPRAAPEALAGYPLYWAGDLITLSFALRAFGVELDVPSLVLAYATGYVITSAPLPAGASGFAEASLAFALHAVGVPLGEAVLATFVYRFCTFWLPIPVALALLPTVPGLSEDLRRHAVSARRKSDTGSE